MAGVGWAVRVSFRGVWMAPTALVLTAAVRAAAGPNAFLDTLGPVLVGLTMLFAVVVLVTLVVLGVRALAARHRRALDDVVAGARRARTDYHHW
jgi:hypothetical protein